MPIKLDSSFFITEDNQVIPELPFIEIRINMACHPYFYYDAKPGDNKKYFVLASIFTHDLSFGVSECKDWGKISFNVDNNFVSKST